MRYFGKIGFALHVEAAPGVYVEKIVEKPYKGDVLRHSYSFQNGEGLNSDISISNELSIVADPFLLKNLGVIRYATWLDTRWQVSNADVERPRVTLSLGGVYNGPEPES